jgi:hypothetical protein
MIPHLLLTLNFPRARQVKSFSDAHRKLAVGCLLNCEQAVITMSDPDLSEGKGMEVEKVVLRCKAQLTGGPFLGVLTLLYSAVY